MAQIQAKMENNERQRMSRNQMDAARLQTDREKAAGDLAIKRTEKQLQAQNLANQHDTF